MAILASSVSVRRFGFNGGYVLSACGAIASLTLISISTFVLRLTCYWCLGSATVMVLLFISYCVSASLDSDSDVHSKKSNLAVTLAAYILAIGSLVWITPHMLHKRSVQSINLEILSTLDPAILVPQGCHRFGAESPYQVVFFGDLECPTCHLTFPRVKTLADKGKFELIFRHCPLRIHPLANSAAIAAEEAGLGGHFWDFLNDACRDDLTADRLDMIRQRWCPAKLDSAQISQVESRLVSDQRAGLKLEITTVPTILLIDRNKTVQVSSASQLEQKFG